MSKVDLKKDIEKRVKNKIGRKHKRDAKLQELEDQLEFAESRCGTLKQQLDYIKLLYGCKKSDNPEKSISKEKGHGDGCNVNQFVYSEVPRWDDQHESFGGREDGDCPDYTKRDLSHTISNTTNSSPQQMSSVPGREKEDDFKRKGFIKPKSHFKLLKVKRKGGKKIKKKRKGDILSMSKVSNTSSQSKSQMISEAVVEIYKNAAVNVESEIGFEVLNKKKGTRTNEGGAEIKKLRTKRNSEAAKDKGADSKTKSCNALNLKRKCVMKEEGIQTESPIEMDILQQNKKMEVNDFLNKDSLTKTENFFEAVKGYCQPTISSKRKQVDRDIYSNLANINVRNIPFIAARSTAPSHNIGVNIQQVLSIIKKRQPIGGGDSLINTNSESYQDPVVALLSPKKAGTKISEVESNLENGGTISTSSDNKKRTVGVRTNLSHWKSNSDFVKEKSLVLNEKTEEEQANDWNSKVDKLKKVLIFLHEDFTSLSQKYKKLQKKLTKRNISKMDAKDELADIERELEKKEEEITVVIGLYKEVLSLREELKKCQEKCNLFACGRTFMFEGLKQSSSTHMQMTTLLRKIQNFQDQLKG